MRAGRQKRRTLTLLAAGAPPPATRACPAGVTRSEECTGSGERRRGRSLTLLAAGAPPPMWAAQVSYAGVSRSEGGGAAAAVLAAEGQRGGEDVALTLPAAGAPPPTACATHAGVKAVCLGEQLEGQRGGREAEKPWPEPAHTPQLHQPPPLPFPAAEDTQH